MLIWFTYVIVAYFVDKQLSNMIVLSMFFMAFNTCPILYILFEKEYNNYEKC
jgi:accessory gene regulator protein AgrB